MAREPAPGQRWMQVLGSWWLLAGVVFLVYAVSPIRATTNDPTFVPMTAHSLVHDRDLALDEFGADRLTGHPVVVSDGSLPAGVVVTDPTELRLAVADPDVDVTDYFPWTTSVLLVPGIIATDAASAVFDTPSTDDLIRSGRPDTAHGLVAIHVLTASAVVVGAVLLSRATALAMLSGDERRRRLLANVSALVFALGTSAWSTASRALWQHTPSILVLSAALFVAVRIDLDPEGRWADRGSALLGALVVTAAVVRPTNLWFAVCMLAWVLFRLRWRAWPTLLGAGAAAVLFVAANVALLGRVVPEYYSSSRIVVGDWFIEAVGANWFSPSRGLLLASPVLVLAVPGVVIAWKERERRPFLLAVGTPVVAVTLSVSAFPHWWAGHTFGPRFMTEAVPSLFVLSLPAVGRVFSPDGFARGWEQRVAMAAVGVLAVSSVLFHGTGAASTSASCWNVYPVDVDSDPSRVWSLTEAQVLEPFHRVLDADRREAQNRVCLTRPDA